MGFSKLTFKAKVEQFGEPKMLDWQTVYSGLDGSRYGVGFLSNNSTTFTIDSCQCLMVRNLSAEVASSGYRLYLLLSGQTSIASAGIQLSVTDYCVLKPSRQHHYHLLASATAKVYYEYLYYTK